MKRNIINSEMQEEQRRIVAYLDGVQARLASHTGMISLRQLQSAKGEELSPPFHFGDATQSALLQSVQSKPALSHVEGSAFQKG